MTIDLATHNYKPSLAEIASIDRDIADARSAHLKAAKPTQKRKKAKST